MATSAVRRGLRYVVCAALVSIIAYGIWSIVGERRATQRLVEGSIARQTALLGKYHQKFLDDQRFAAALTLFARRVGNRDAAPILGARVHWSGTPRPSDSTTTREEALAGSLDGSMSQKLDKDWLATDPAILEGLDFGWMALLSDFDFWDLDANGAGAQSADIEPPVPGLELVTWAKLRLVKGMQEGKPVEAIRDVEQLARLYATTESITAVEQSMLFVALTDKVRDHLMRRGWSVDALGRPLGPDGRKRVHRTLRGAMAYVDLSTPAIFTADWGRITVGRCAALSHGLSVALASRPLLIHSQGAAYERLGQLLAASPECRLRRVRSLWAHPESVKATTQCGRWYERLLHRWLPEACTQDGEFAVTIARQGWLDQYDSQAIQ